MTDKQTIEQIIREFFGEMAGAKLEDDDGRLVDNDSNWGFDPAELAKRINEHMAFA